MAEKRRSRRLAASGVRAVLSKRLQLRLIMCFFISSAVSSRRISAQETYSWYQCIQRCTLEQDACAFEANWRVTSCHFKNVCIDTRTQDITFFRNPQGDGASVHTDEFYHRKGFPSPLAYMSGGNQGPQEDNPNKLVKVEVMSRPFPQKKFQLPGPVVYMAPFTPDNFGHCLADNVFPAYRLLRRFGLADQPATFVFKDYDVERECKPGQVSRSCKNLQSLLQPVLTRSQLYSVGSGQLAPNVTKYACTQDLVVGFGKLGMYSDSDVWDQFNVRLLKAVGVPPLRVPQRHKILVFSKTGRRMTTNVPSMAQHLGKVFNVDTQVVDIAKMSLAMQAQLVNSATIVISPCGGLSFSSVFLPKHAAAIFICTYDPDAKLQLQIERFWYDRQTRFQALYYPVDETEVTINTTFVVKGAGADHELTPGNLYRNFADITVSLPKMVKVVHSALSMVELGLGWDLSYTIPPTVGVADV